jgi:hypothetical protein
VRQALLFILVCIFCFLFILSFLVWFFLWPPKEVLTLLFFLHRENGDFSILMKILYLKYFFSTKSPASQAEYMFSIIGYGVYGSNMQVIHNAKTQIFIWELHEDCDCNIMSPL